jgi:predicted TIM-barrel fold metal-dependent hydrolase
MPEPLLVDVHMHLYETKAAGDWWKAGYEIWEYGEKHDVQFGPYSGTLEDALTAMAEAGYRHGVAVNLFSMDLFKQEAVAMLPSELGSEERSRAVIEIEAGLPDRLREFNRWLVDALASVEQITPFVAVDPWALPPEESVAHLWEMAECGAAGIKLHPVVQRFMPGDPRMLPVYRACRELDLVVLLHTGASRDGTSYGEPVAMAEVLREFPDLRVVLAHLGGGAWGQTESLARHFPNATFDLCEIIEWTGAPKAPTEEELAAMIRGIGPERVMLGTDFPWYDLGHTAQRVMALPGLSEAEKEAVLGANAARILNLPV